MDQQEYQIKLVMLPFAKKKEARDANRISEEFSWKLHYGSTHRCISALQQHEKRSVMEHYYNEKAIKPRPFKLVNLAHFLLASVACTNRASAHLAVDGVVLN
jgi:hypothetical protein